jgi:Na+/proline symporter
VDYAVILTTPDWIIIALYMLGMIGVGLWAMTKIKDCGGFLLGKRKLGKLMMIAAQFGSGISSNHPVSVASMSYQHGFSGIWLSLAFLFVTPFYWLYPPIFRRARMVTMVDFVHLRYGRAMEIFYNLTNLLGGAIAIGLGVKTAGVVINVMSGGGISEIWAQGIIVGLILAYSVPGGIIAAYATDILQGLLIVVLSFLLIPFAAQSVGGFQGLHEKVPAEIFALVSKEGLSFAWIFWFVFGMVFASSGWGTNASFGGARNEWAARMTVFGSLAKRVCTVGWMLVGVFAIAYYGDTQTIDPDSVFAQMCVDLLPVGLRGLMVSSILAAVMSSVDAGMIHTASILTNNIYKEFFVKNASPGHYLLFARVSGISLVLCGWLVATSIESLVRIVLVCEQYGALVGVSVFGSLVWRKSTRAGAIASLLVMSPLFYYGSMYREDLPFTVWTPLYLLPGIATFFLVSLFTKQHNDEEVAELYARLDTPVGEEHLLAEKGIEIDLLEELDGESVDVTEKDHDVSKRLWLLDFLTWPVKIAKKEAKLSDYWVDLVGFFGVVAFACLFLLGVYWIAQIGA